MDKEKKYVHSQISRQAREADIKRGDVERSVDNAIKFIL